MFAKKRKLEEHTPCENLIDDKERNIYSDGNKIYFFSPIDKYSVFCLNKEIDDVVFNLKLNKHISPFIQLFIHSDGGDLYAGISAMEHIRTCEIPIHSYVDGFVASAATLLLIASTKKFMFKYSEILIHQLTTGVWGKYEEIVEETKNCKKLMKNLKNLYKSFTAIPDEILDQLMTKEITLNSSKCLKYKIVDCVI